MLKNHLHIISFSIPYPPNYGGIIDVYHKLVALKSAGIKIHLHCFEYDRNPAEELNELCEVVHYYPRKTGLCSAKSIKPYIVESRQSEALMECLLKDNYPILFEGLHTCYYLNDKRLANRKKIYRESNIEHQYYFNLFKAEKTPGRKAYYLVEALKLKIYQKTLKHADLMLAVSESDSNYLQKKFPLNKIVHLPSFHANDNMAAATGVGGYALYHGNLSVAENIKAAQYIATKIAPFCDLPVVFTGLNPTDQVNQYVKSCKNITLVPNPNNQEMLRLIKNAQVHIMITFQATGLKLKLLNTVYLGRHIIANKAMYNGTVIGKLVIHAENADEFITAINKTAHTPFSVDDVTYRKSILNGFYSNTKNAQKLTTLIFD